MDKEEAEIQFSEILLNHLTAKERMDVVYIHLANDVLTEGEERGEGFVYKLGCVKPKGGFSTFE